MKTELAFVKLAAVLSLALGLATTRLAAQGSFEYDWMGGAPGFTGKIFLDASASAGAPNGGSQADVLPGSYLVTPLGNFPVYDPASTFALSPYPGNVRWDASQITLMFLIFGATNAIAYPVYGQQAVGAAVVGSTGVTQGVETGVLPTGGGFQTIKATGDFGGQWLAAPEPSTLALTGLGAAAWLGYRRRVMSGR